MKVWELIAELEKAPAGLEVKACSFNERTESVDEASVECCSVSDDRVYIDIDRILGRAVK